MLMTGGIKKLITLILLMFSVLFFPADTARGDEPFVSADFTLGAGYSVDSLDWNIAGTSAGTGPNILSELAWSDLAISQVKGQGRVALAKHVYLKGSLAGGLIFDGENQDSDYLGDNRTLEFSRSNNNSDAGNVWDASAGAGYRTEVSFTTGVLQ